MNRSIWIGFDAREAEAFAVCRASVYRNIDPSIPVHALVMSDLVSAGLYTRETKRKLGRLWDGPSKAYMSTEFANTRFLVPYLCNYEGWALFMDCDMLVRARLDEVFAAADPEKAVTCVHHNHVPENTEKMDNQVQQKYARKNWSSFMLFNCGHPANRSLDLKLVNGAPGRDLHRFCWLKDSQIGEIGPEWNYLVGHSDPSIDPKVVHFTDGGPWFAGFKDIEYADEYRAELIRWANSRSMPL